MKKTIDVARKDDNLKPIVPEVQEIANGIKE